MDVKQYTAQNLGEQMVLTEYHLTDYLRETGGIPEDIGAYKTPQPQVGLKEDAEFCIECLSKHALALGGFAKEGVQFFQGNPYFAKVSELATDLYNATPDFDRDKALQFYNNLRTLRKNLVAKHLILGNLETQTTHHLSGEHIKK